MECSYLMKKKRIIAIIQARTSSTRLPGKMLMPILGKPMLLRVIERVKQAKFIDTIIVATSVHPSDDKIAALCQKNRIHCFRGSLNYVLKRFHDAAKIHHADLALRITADCPLIDPKLIDKLIKFFIKIKKYDYAGLPIYNGGLKNKSFPDGMDCEIFTFAALEKVYQLATTDFQKEHVTPYIRQHPHQFRIGHLLPKEKYPGIKLSVDTKEELELVRKIYTSLYPKKKNFTLSDIINLTVVAQLAEH